MATRTPTRLAGPSLLTASAATIYTVQGATTAVVRHIHVANEDVAQRTLTLSIGADAAGTRLFNAFPLAAGQHYDLFAYIPMAATEIVQASADVTNKLAITIGGDQIA
jgi:hypothetical protein